MLVTFGALALGLSMIGLYAALAFAVGERTREIAVRLALGASRADVGGLVFRRGMAIVLLGITAGVAACVIAGPFLAHLLYGVSPRDPLAIDRRAGGADRGRGAGDLAAGPARHATESDHRPAGRVKISVAAHTSNRSHSRLARSISWRNRASPRTLSRYRSCSERNG